MSVVDEAGAEAGVSEYSGEFEDEVFVDKVPAPSIEPSIVDKENVVNNNFGETNDGNDKELAWTGEGLGKPEKSQVSFNLGGSIVSIDRNEPNALLGGSLASLDTSTMGFAHDLAYFGDADQYHLWHKSRRDMTSSVTTNTVVMVCTQCDILCSTNTVINYVVDKVAFPMKDAMGVLPYKGRRNKRLTTWKKGETPWQTLRMTEAKVERNKILKDEREEFLMNLRFEQDEREIVRHFLASRIQALWRGVVSRKINGDRRLMRPVPYVLKKKPKYRVVPSVIQDELCALASLMNLDPIPGLSLISRGKASKRMRQIQFAAALRMQKFFKMLYTRSTCAKVMDHMRYLKIHNAARIVARFFKSLKMRTFASRCRTENQNRAALVIQKCARIFVSYGRVRRMRRFVVQLRRERTASTILARNFKKKFTSGKVKIIDACLCTEKNLANEIVNECIDICVAERKSELMQEFSVDAVTEVLVEEMIVADVNAEEEARIAIELQRMEEEMKQYEKERLEVERQLREREEAEERAKEEEAQRAVQEAKAAAAAEAAPSDSAQNRMDILSALVTETVAKATEMAIAKSPAYKCKGKAEQRKFSDEEVAAVDSAVVVEEAVLSAAPSASPAQSVEQTAAELSSFYISEAVIKSRPQSPVLGVARKQTQDIIKTASAKVSSTSSRAASAAEVLWSDCESVPFLLLSRSFLEANDVLKRLEGLNASNETVRSLLLSRAALYRGTLARMQHDYSAAMKHYETAKKLSLLVFPTNGHPWAHEIINSMAVCRHHQGMCTAAMAIFQELRTIQDDAVFDNQKYEGVDIQILAHLKRAGDEVGLSLSKVQTIIDQARLLLTCGKYNDAKDGIDLAASLIESPKISHNEIHASLAKARADWDLQVRCNASLSVERLLSIQRERFDAHTPVEDEEAQDRHPALVGTLIRVLKSQISQSQFDDCNYYVTRVLELREKESGVKSVSYSDALHVSAMLHRAKGSFVIGVESANNALAIRKRVLGNEHFLVAESLSLLGALQLDLSNPVAAKPLLDEALAIQKKCFTEEKHLVTFQIKQSIARYYTWVGSFEKGIEMYNEIIDGLQSEAKEDGLADHLLIQSSKIEIARTFQKLGKYDDCKFLVSEAGRSLALITGGKHSLVIESLLVLARCLCSQFKFDDANRILVRALTICNVLFGDFHPMIGEIHRISAECQYSRGFYIEANEKNAQGINICVNSFTPRSPHFTQSILMRARLSCRMGRLEESKALFEHALEDTKTCLGQDSYQYAEVLGAFAECQLLRKDEILAEGTIKSAMTIVQKYFGPQSIANVELMRSFATFLIKSGDSEKISQAQAVLRDGVLPVQEKILGKTHPSTLYSRALQGLSARMLETPRNSDEIDEEMHKNQDAIDDALDVFDRIVGMSAEHPWVKMLGGFVETPSVSAGGVASDSSGSTPDVEESATNAANPKTP